MSLAGCDVAKRSSAVMKIAISLVLALTTLVSTRQAQATDLVTPFKRFVGTVGLGVAGGLMIATVASYRLAGHLGERLDNAHSTAPAAEIPIGRGKVLTVNPDSIGWNAGGGRRQLLAQTPRSLHNRGHTHLTDVIFPEVYRTASSTSTSDLEYRPLRFGRFLVGPVLRAGSRLVHAVAAPRQAQAPQHAAGGGAGRIR